MPDDFQQITEIVRTARMPLHLQPFQQQIPSQAVQQRQMTRGIVNMCHPNPHLRGFHIDEPMLNERRGNLPPDACIEDQRLFAFNEWSKAVKLYKDWFRAARRHERWRMVVRCFPTKTEANKNNLLHAGAVRQCENSAAHVNQAPPAGVCLACRVVSHTHIANTENHLLNHTFWPLCRSCSEDAFLKSDGREGCRCGAGWLCHRCRHAGLVEGKARNEAEWDLRKGLEGVRCRCSKDLSTPEAKADVTVLQCAGCTGLIRTGWDARQEMILIRRFRRDRNRRAVGDS